MHTHHAPPALGQNVNELVRGPYALIAAYDTWAHALDKFFAAYNALEPHEKELLPPLNIKV